MADIIWNQGYSPAEAERGKFVALDSTTITNYPTGGRGKYAMLTYNVAPVAITLAGSALNVSVGVSGIDVQNWNALIQETHTDLPLSATVSINKDYNIPDSIWIGTSSFSPQGVINTIPYSFKEVEIQNKTQDSVFILLSSTTYENTTNYGIEIPTGTYYSTTKDISQLSVASVSGGDVRIIGHYKG